MLGSAWFDSYSTGPDLLQNRRILNLVVACQEEDLRDHLRRTRIVVRKRQEQAAAMLRVYRNDTERTAGHAMHNRAAEVHAVVGELAFDEYVRALHSNVFELEQLARLAEQAGT